jgi:Amt family ammonium transporter
MKRKLLPAAAAAAAGTLALPASALADSLDAANSGGLGESVPINTLWVVISAILVLFMLAGLLSLEAGMSRMKNVGTLVPKALIGMAVAAMIYWACGFAFAFGNGEIIGSTGFFLRDYGDPQEAFGIMGLSDAMIESKWLFQFAFCAVCLAIVWGSTLERIKFHAHAIFALVFAGFIYPLASHWVFGGGWLQTNVGMQDFAGSTAVHLVGATGALAALLVLGPRRGRYGSDGAPRPIPGHSMYILGLGMFILLIGWFGFNAGSALGVMDGRFAEVAMVTMLGASGGILGAYFMTVVLQRTVDIGMVCNGLIAGLVAITAPSGYVENWAAPIIGIVGGLIVVPAIMFIDRKVDDPVGVLSAHGLAGIWGTLACGLFTAPRFAQYAGIGDPNGGLVYSGSFEQLLDQAIGVVVVFALVLTLCLITWYAIARTIGLRVS